MMTTEIPIIPYAQGVRVTRILIFFCLGSGYRFTVVIVVKSRKPA
nr:MAG TPA: hypothetical protein [Caudoviricetes sp.]